MQLHTTPALVEQRREWVFLILAGVFLGAMTMLNIIGITRFIQLGPLTLAVGVLPYPLTFLCTDLIGEFYGRRRANMVVWVGLGLNVLVLGVIWLGAALPAVAPETQPPWQTLPLSSPVFMPNGTSVDGNVEFFHLIYATTFGAVFASMAAYLAAQFCDVYLFHFWKRVTKGKHLWLRNNGSTIVSQLVDSVMVISITFGAAYWRGDFSASQMATLVSHNYAFKLAAAMLDTIPFYFIVYFLIRYLGHDPTKSHEEIA